MASGDFDALMDQVEILVSKSSVSYASLSDFDALMDQVEILSSGFESLDVQMVMFICDVKKSKLMQMCCGTTHAVRFVRESTIGASFLSEFLDFSQGHIKKKKTELPQKKVTPATRSEGIGLEMSVDEVANQDAGNKSHDQQSTFAKQMAKDVSENVGQRKKPQKFSEYVQKKPKNHESENVKDKVPNDEDRTTSTTDHAESTENTEESNDDYVIEIKQEPIDPDEVESEFYESNMEQSNSAEFMYSEDRSPSDLSEQASLFGGQFKTEPEDYGEEDYYEENIPSKLYRNTGRDLLTRKPRPLRISLNSRRPKGGTTFIMRNNVGEYTDSDAEMLANHNEMFTSSFGDSMMSASAMLSNNWTNIIEETLHRSHAKRNSSDRMSFYNYNTGEEIQMSEGNDVDINCGENGEDLGSTSMLIDYEKARSAERSLKWGINMLQDEDYIKASSGGRCKRGKYAFYSPELKATIARFALEKGACKAARHFSQILGKRLSESTVRSFKNAYLLQKKMADVDVLEELTPKRRGKPKQLELITMEQLTGPAEVPDANSGEKSDNGNKNDNEEKGENGESCSQVDNTKGGTEGTLMKMESDGDQFESMESNVESNVDEDVQVSQGEEFVQSKAATRRKRGKYALYSPEQKAKIARFALDNGASSAARHFTESLGRKISESTVRSFKNAYLLRKKVTRVDIVEELTPKRRGKPKLLGETLDNEVCSYLKDLWEAGGVVNSTIVQSIGRGVILDTDHTLLKEHGGYIDVSREWARSILRRLNFIKRKPVKGVEELPQDFDQIKSKFLDRITQVRTENDIPSELVINWGQAGLNLVPVSDWTASETESLQSPILHPEDRRQVTAVFACTLSGALLAPQLIYQGKTEMCHPKVDFPDDWNITHTDTRWTTESTMIEYIQKVIIPYVDDVRYSIGGDGNQTALAIFEILLAHRSERLLDILKEANIRVLFVPAACTDQLHPINQMPVKLFKEELKQYFQNWYTDEVAKQLQSNKHGDGGGSVRIDIKTSTLKPMHAEWVIRVFNKLQAERDLFIHAFNKIGIF